MSILNILTQVEPEMCVSYSNQFPPYVLFADYLVPLGMINGNIPDSSITASSWNNDARVPYHARLQGDSWWSNDNSDSNPWLQVDLLATYNVAAILTEGTFSTRWVGVMTVQFGNNPATLEFIKDSNGEPKVCLYIVYVISYRTTLQGGT